MNTLRLRVGTVAAAVLAFLPVLAHTAAARVDVSIGEVAAINAAGQPRALRKGDAIVQGDTARTNGGRVQLRFTDGAYVALQPDTVFRVDEYRFEGRADGSDGASGEATTPLSIHGAAAFTRVPNTQS